MRPEEIVAAESPNRLRDHLSRTSRYNPTRSLTAITGQLSQEYEDRFLIELVQNAYDAQPPGTSNGEVRVRLDESHPDGPVLYVANSGQPFSEANFDALTNVAQSSKPPGEGIGNKGVGFRSVLQVCDSPEIYSCNPGAPTAAGFNGFCFGFASDAQMRAMVRDDAEFHIVKRDFSRYLLPVAIVPLDPFLHALRDEGLVTVVRLPLVTPRAVELAREQVKRLLAPTPPIALFLDRLRAISVEHVDAEGTVDQTEVDRHVEEVTAPAGGPRLQWITTVGRRYLTTTRILEAAEVADVVREAVAEHQLDAAWAEWHSDVEVSLAVPFGHDEQGLQPVSYTYLPMRVPSPVHAFMHAPFHTKMARLDLSQRSLFNDFLIDEAASLAAETVQVLTVGEGVGLDPAVRRAAVADLLSWDDGHLQRLEAGLEQLGLDLGSSALIPACGPEGNSWASLNSVRVWSEPKLEILSLEAIAAYALVLDESLGERRMERVITLARQYLGHGLGPSDSEVADWVEQIAMTTKRRAAPWNRFLADVAVAFENRNVSALQGRMILIDDNLNLRRTGPWPPTEVSSSDPTVFIPPLSTGVGAKIDADDTDLTTVPKNLQRGFTFLHKGVAVRTRVGSTYRRTAVGELLQQASLVEPFELASILGHIRRLLAGKASDTTHRQALAWVHAQEDASRSNVADLGDLGLRVPTAKGWIVADQAVFSESWGTPRAPTVARLVEVAGPLAPSIQSFGERTIVDPDEWPFRVKNPDSLRDFLARCGVRDGLFPTPLRSRTAIRLNGVNFGAHAVADRFGLERRSEWARHISESWRPIFEGPYTPYTGDQELWVVPGQDDWDSLGPVAMDLLAGAILESIADWPDEVWVYGFRRVSPHHRSKPDPQTWPSPVKSFVSREPWFPMANPGRRDDRYFVAVSKGWTFDESANEVAPRFARIAPVDHRRRLAASPRAQQRLGSLGLSTWNEPASAGRRLRELAALVAEGEIAEAELLSVRRAVAKAWSEYVALPPTPAGTPKALVVSRGSVMATIEPSAADPPEVFVHDTPFGLAAQVLEALAIPILVSDPADGEQIMGALRASEGVIVRRTSTVAAIVELDRVAISASADAGDAFLGRFDLWIIRTLLAILDIRSTRFARITDKVLHDVEAVIRRLRLATGSRIDLTVDGRTVAVGGRLSECVHIDDSDHPLLVLNDTGISVPSWRALEVVADDLADVVRQTSAASEIRAAALAFQRTVGEWREPTDAEIAQVLRCSVESVTEVLRDLRTSSDHLRLLLAPVVGAMAGVAAARRVESELAADVDDLGRLLSELVGDDCARELLANARRSESIDVIRREMAIDLGPLNAALRELGRSPLHFELLHQSALNSYLNEHRVELLESLRQRFLGLFEATADLSRYTAAREFRDVRTEASWLDEYEFPTTEMLAELLDTWLDDQGAEIKPSRPLQPIDSVREANRDLLDRVLPVARRTMVAWRHKHRCSDREDIPELQAMRDVLASSGCLDFVELSDHDLPRWLAAVGQWPDGMPHSLNLLTLGLDEADLDAAATSSARSAELRRRRRTELTFGGRSFDTSTDELLELIGVVAASVSDDFLHAPATPVKLESITPRDPGRRNEPSDSRRTPTSYGGTRSSSEQLSAIGLLGEILAFRWLQSVYKETTPDSWVSRNRAYLLGGHLGDDGLGYDFRIARRSETLLFEVKATTTDDYEFDIGESELRAARAARKGTYRIIFIRSVLQPDASQLFVLPNPLEPAAASSFLQVNQGMRYRFDPGLRKAT